jgi:probable HAF family extracellular repeat protein
MCTATILAFSGCRPIVDADPPRALADAQANPDATVTITDLGTLGGLASEGLRINDGGQVLGRSQTASGEVHVFLWTDGTMSDIGASFYPLDLNNAGQVAGFGYANSHAVLWNEGQLTDLGTLGGAWSYPVGCVLFQGAPICGFGRYEPIIIDGRVRPVQAINDNGQIIGESATASGDRHGFVWYMGIMTDLGTLGGAWSEPRAINARGQVVGMSATLSGVAHGFLWENGTMTDLGKFEPQDINGQGQIAGSAFFPIVSSYDTIYVRHAALWDKGTVTDLGALDLDQNPYTGSGAQAINDRGDVMGESSSENAYVGTTFIWRAGVMTPIWRDPPGPPDIYPRFMSQRGHVVGYGFSRVCVANACYDDEHAYLWRDGVVIDLGTLPNPTPPEVNSLCMKCSHPNGINTRGDVVGTAYSSDPTYFNQLHAVVWTIGPR